MFLKAIFFLILLHLKLTLILWIAQFYYYKLFNKVVLCVCKCKRSFNWFRILSFFPKWKLFLIHLSLETSWLVIMENREKRGFTIKPKFVVFEKKLSFWGEFSLFRTCETRLVVSFNFAENVLAISSGISGRIKERNSVLFKGISLFHIILDCILKRQSDAT